MTGSWLTAQPVISVRFANPVFDCTTQVYDVDVEFQSNTPDQQVYGVNVRFFYNDDILEFLSFAEFQQGYSQMGGVDISTGTAASGMSLLGFSGPNEHVNGSVYRKFPSNIFISTTGWTKLFNIRFHVDDIDSFNIDNFCPSLVWDLREDNSGGISTGSSGVVITLVNGSSTTAPATENVVQFNWAYDGIPGDPHGYPVEIDCIPTLCSVAPMTILPFTQVLAPGLVDLPVVVVNFSNIGAFSLVFEYDPNSMTYVSNTPNAVFTPENGLLTVTDNEGNEGKRKITLIYTGNVISLNDSSSLVSLMFNYFSGETSLNWLSDEGACQYYDANNMPLLDVPFSDYYINGMAELLTAPIVQIDSICAVENEYATFAVRVWGFTDIQAGSLTLDYDPDVLVYYNSSPNAVFNGSYQTDIIYPGRIEMEWSGDNLSLDDEVVLIYLTFIYLGGGSDLIWFDNGSSCQFIQSNLSLPLYDEPLESFYYNGNIASPVFIWTGGSSDDWNTNSNWLSNKVPHQFANVIIDPSYSPPYWPVFPGNFTVGVHCQNITLYNDAHLIINGDFTINPGHTAAINGTGNIKIDGSWTNSGIFLPGEGTIEFSGEGDAVVATGVSPGNYVAAYVLSTFNPGMIPITGGLAGPSGNNAHLDISLEFDFNYLGINYSQARINTNGWLSLDQSGSDATSHDNAILFNLLTPSNILAPWWDDLIADENTAISYKSEGIAPDRVFTAEWKNISAYSYGASTRLNFQVKLYEFTNVIEFCYGDLVPGTHNPAESASIGIKDATGGAGNFLEATNNSISLALPCLISTNDWPANNFRFTPPTENSTESFYRLLISKVYGHLAIQKNTQVTGID